MLSVLDALYLSSHAPMLSHDTLLLCLNSILVVWAFGTYSGLVSCGLVQDISDTIKRIISHTTVSAIILTAY